MPLPQEVVYNLTFYGVDFDASSSSNMVTLELREATNVDIVETSYYMIPLPQ